MLLPSLIFIMGVSGSGKTTIGQKLAARTGIPFFDADDFHPEANREKMKAGHALTDEDRKEWLMRLNEVARQQAHTTGAIIACSALKEKYRMQLIAGIHSPIQWVFLKGSFELISQRLQLRKDHYMPPSLLQSQFDILEAPAGAILADISNDPDSIVAGILQQLS